MHKDGPCAVVVISILIFRNPVSSAGMIGYTITVLGVVFYSEAGGTSTHSQARTHQSHVFEASFDVHILFHLSSPAAACMHEPRVCLRVSLNNRAKELRHRMPWVTSICVTGSVFV